MPGPVSEQVFKTLLTNKSAGAAAATEVAEPAVSTPATSRVTTRPRTTQPPGVLDRKDAAKDSVGCGPGARTKSDIGDNSEVRRPGNVCVCPATDDRER